MIFGAGATKVKVTGKTSYTAPVPDPAVAMRSNLAVVGVAVAPIVGDVAPAAGAHVPDTLNVLLEFVGEASKPEAFVIADVVVRAPVVNVYALPISCT